MARNDTPEDPETRASADDMAGGGGRRRHKPLDSLERVRRELQAVYYAQKDEKLSMDIAKGRAYLLGQLLAVLKAEQADEAAIEARLAELERRLSGVAHAH